MAGPPAPSSSRDNAIGLVLIAAAVLIGVVLLAKGYDNEGGVVATDSVSSSDATTTTVAGGDTTTTEAPAQADPPAEVPVKVANASGASGLASRTRSTLQGAGYTQVTITDAPAVVGSTQVLFARGSKPEAQAVAEALGVDGAAVQAMPDPPPVTLDGATVLVMAGPDLNS